MIAQKELPDLSQRHVINSEKRNTILLVDDEPTLLSLAKSILSYHGFNVLTAMTAEQAAAISQNYNDIIDFLICDVNLPGRSGIYLANQLNSERDIKVVLVSGDLEIDSMVRQVNFPLLGYFAKPFSLRTLASLLQDSLAGA